MRRTSRNLACFNNTQTQRKISYPQRICTQYCFFIYVESYGFEYCIFSAYDMYNWIKLCGKRWDSHVSR